MHGGLEDVVAAETMLSDVDGVKGTLVIRGYALDALAGSTSFEDMVRLLLEGLLPLPDDLRGALGEARAEVFSVAQADTTGLLDLDPVDALRALLARLGDGDDTASALRLLAAPGVFTAAVLRTRAGGTAVAPDAGLGHAADVLRMQSGQEPEAAQAAALDRYLVTVADHGLNASTFVSRIIASTGAGLTSSAIGALGALKGPLHGGAPGPVLDMLDAVGVPQEAERWVAAALADGQRLMGFGHRIYRVRDPRADALKAAVRDLAAAGAIAPDRLALAEAVEAAALRKLRQRKPDRVLDTNVEFYTALLLEALGFPRDAFTCVFAMGRVIGWVAHAREQAFTGRLIRPQSRYIGPQPQEAA